MKDRLPVRFWGAIVGLTGLGAALTLGVSIYYWAAPWIPLAGFLLFGVTPIVFSTLLSSLVFDPRKTSDAFVSRDSPPVGRRLSMSVLPIAVGAIVFGSVVSVWFSPQARSAAVAAVAGQRMTEPVERALRDPSNDVRLAACEQLGELGAVPPSRRLLHLLDDPDEAVLECALRQLPASAPGSAPGVLRLMTARWYDSLMSQEDGPAACVLAERIRVAGRAGVGGASPRLMQCALDAQSGPARQCCAQSFRASLVGPGAEPYMLMPPIEVLARTSFVTHLPSLLHASFAPGAEAEQRRQALRLGTERSNAWALALSCEALSEAGADHREPISTAVAHHVSSERCSLAPATERTVRLWSAICSAVVPPGELDGADGTEPERLCVGIQGAIAVDAVNEAQHQVGIALRHGAQPDRRASVIAKLLDYSANAGSGLDSTVEASRSNTKLDPSTSKEMGRILDSVIDDGPAKEQMRDAFHFIVGGGGQGAPTEP